MEYPLFETSCNFQSILINILLVLIVDVGMNAMSTELIPTTMNKNLMYNYLHGTKIEQQYISAKFIYDENL